MSDVRADWTARIHDRSDRGAAPAPALPAPAGLVAVAGAGHVTLDWEPVPDAVGYLVERAEGDGPFAVVDHGGMDVLAQPAPPYADTTGEPGRTVRYRVRAIAAVDAPGAPSGAVEATPGSGPAGAVTLRVDAAAAGTSMARPWEPVVGSDHLALLRSRDEVGGRALGAELELALRRVHDELGVRRVRAHAILGDDLGVYREVDGEPVHDFSGVDDVLETVLAIGLEPVVELGFMPRDLAADPARTVFTYGAIVSPPRDWQRWSRLVEALVRHLLSRYGERARGWDFEVWNEANLEVFWSSDRDTWLRLYDVTAAAVKRVDAALAVGGPASAAAGWIDAFLAHAASTGCPVDFVSTHAYGSPPLDLRPALARHGFAAARILWTEWGVTPTHFAPVNDTVFAATFLLAGMRSAAGRLDALSYWVASDAFEELGRPPALVHGGFGLLAIGGVPKPRFHALAMLAALGRTELPVAVSGDGAGGLVQAWAGRREDGTVTVLAWTWTLDQSKADRAGTAAPSLLAREVGIEVVGLPDGPAEAVVRRLEPGLGDLAAAAAAIGIDGWPRPEQWAALADRAALPVETLRRDAEAGRVRWSGVLPMPAAVLIELRPVPPADREEDR